MAYYCEELLFLNQQHQALCFNVWKRYL